MNDDGRVASGVDFDFQQAWNDIRRFKGVAIATAMIVTAASIAFAVLATPTYRVTTLLMPAEESPVGGAMRGLGDLGALAALAGLGAGTGNMAIEAEALLKSRKLSEDFIREQNLLPALFPDEWDSKRAEWRVSSDKAPTISDGYLKFDRKIRQVVKDRKSGLISLTIQWRDPAVAARWANALVGRVNETMRIRALEESAATITQLEQQLAATNLVTLESSLGKLLQSQIEKQTLAKVRSEYALRVVDPPVVPGPDEQIFPRKGLLIAAGLVTGVALGILVALVLGRLRREGPTAAETAGA